MNETHSNGTLICLVPVLGITYDRFDLSDDTHWTELLASLVRKVGTALVDQLEEEVQAQLSQQLERPELRERRAAVQHVQQTLRFEVPQLPESAKDALEPLLRRTLELADSELFLSELSRMLETHEITSLERLVLLNRLAPESLIEIQLFDGPQETQTGPGLRLVSDLEDPPTES